VRFYAKFPWVQAFTGLVWIALAYLDLHKPPVTSGVHAAYLVSAACWILLSIWAVASYYLIYWDLESDALLERRFLTFRRVEYAAIANVDPWGGQRAASGTINIQFGELGSALNPRTSVTASPLDRETFLNTLRKHAEQAEFSV
jgi:hypothetical protein